MLTVMYAAENDFLSACRGERLGAMRCRKIRDSDGDLSYLEKQLDENRQKLIINLNKSNFSKVQLRDTIYMADSAGRSDFLCELISFKK